MRKGPALGLVATALLASAVAAPSASAECPDDVTCNASNVVSVEIIGGGLSIGTASSAQVDLAAGTLGSITGTLDGSLPETTVTDDRGTFVGWAVTAKTDGDLTSTGSVIDLGDDRTAGPLNIDAGTLAAGTGLLPTGGVAPGSGKLNPTQPVTLFEMPAATGGALSLLPGGGSYSFSPALSLTVPAGTPTGTYTTTVTQTVA